MGLYVRSYNSRELVCGQFFSQNAKNSPKLCFEVADTEGKRAKGLMFRKPEEMAEDRGMIFVYPEEGMRSFWMKNTFIPLDMIFLSSDKKVVGIVHDVAPMTQSPRKVDEMSQYIVELHAGSAKKWGIEKGSELRLEREL